MTRHQPILGTGDLVREVPGGGGAADGLAVQLVEHTRGQIDGVVVAAHALVDDGGSGGLASRFARDRDGAATVGVAVGLLAHEAVGEGNDLVGICGGDAAGAQPGVVVGDVSCAGAALRALATRAGAGAGAGRRGRSWGRSSSRSGRGGQGGRGRCWS